MHSVCLFSAYQFTKSIQPRACWNCGSLNHALPSCTSPRDPGVIRAARDAFRTAKAVLDAEREAEKIASGNDVNESNTSGARLHEGEERRAFRLKCSQLFSPGVVGQQLRDAAGFGKGSIWDGKDDVPYPWLMNMRGTGYPFGWTTDSERKYGESGSATSAALCMD